MKSRATVNLYNVMASGLVGLATGGLVCGIGGRLAMRAVAIIGGIDTEFSVGGTVAIMVIGAIIGLIVGLVYGILRHFIPLRGLGKGLAFGVVLAALISLPFFGAPVGELLLATPAVGAALFGVIGLVYALALEAGLLWLDGRRTTRRQRSVALVWLVPFAFFLAIAFAGMVSLTDEFAHFPPAASNAYLALGLNFIDAHRLHSLLALAFALLYCGLSGVVFLQAGDNRAGSLAALALVVLAAGWFRADPLTAGAMTAFPGVRILPELLKAGGLALIVLTLFVWPDGRFEFGWTRITFVLCCVWLTAWLATPLRGVLPGQLALAITAGFFASGLLALAQRSRRSPAQRRQIAPVLIGFGLAGALVAVLWLAVLARPPMQVRDIPLPETLFVFGPYLLLWLFLPVSLWFGQRAARQVDVVTLVPSNAAHAVRNDYGTNV